MKRFSVLFTLCTFLLVSLCGCSKKTDEPDKTPTPTVSGSENNSSDDGSQDNTIQSEGAISFGGSFVRDNTYLSFGILDGSWAVTGFYSAKDSSTGTLLNGPITFKENADFVYDDGENKLTITFATDSVSIKVDKGTEYSVFAGTFKRSEISSSDSSILSPLSGSPLEHLGRIALAHYMVVGDEVNDCSIDFNASGFSTEYMEKFLLAYADLFLTFKAEPLPDLFDRYLAYSFTEEELNELLLSATAGKFSVDKLNLSSSEIKTKDGLYYVPCHGSYAGGLIVESLSPALVSDALKIQGGVAKLGGISYDVEMTLSTKEDKKNTVTGVTIESISYKMVK